MLAFSGNAAEKIFHFPLSENPPTLDPVEIQDVTSDGVARKIFNGLVRFDHEMKVAPDLAEAVPEWNAADNSFTFKLRKGVKFHNGREMKAADVKYSWERLLDPDISQRTQILEPVVGAKEKLDHKAKDTPGIQAVDDYTIKVTLTGPSPTFLLEIGMVNASIVPREAVEEAAKDGGKFSRKPVGTGPFKLVEWKENEKIVLTRHAEYFGGTPKLNGVVFEVIPEPQNRVDLFLRGEFEVCDIPFGKVKKLRESNPDCISENPTFRTNYLGMAMHKVEGDKTVDANPLGTNLKLRQAINLAVNRKYICNVILEGRGRPALSILPVGMMAHDDALVGSTYDQAKAKALLAEAGFPNGEGLPQLTMLYKNDPDIRKIVIAIQRDLQLIGLKIDLQALDWATFLDRVAKNPPDLFYLGWVADYNDPSNFLYYLFHTKQWGAAGNETRYSNKEVDALLDEAGKIMDQEKRKELYQKAEKIIVAELPWALMDNRINVILVQPYVKNVRGNLCPLDVGHYLNQIDFSTVDLAK
jgi:ABC-type transport system substrate-binding protein